MYHLKINEKEINLKTGKIAWHPEIFWRVFTYKQIFKITFKFLRTFSFSKMYKYNICWLFAIEFFRQTFKVQ